MTELQSVGITTLGEAYSEAKSIVTNGTNDILRPSRRSDLNMIHERLMGAIDESELYSQTFKNFEKNRLTKAYLAALMKRDPRHIFIVEDQGETCGFMISGPDLGVLWLYWSYIFPEKRRNNYAMPAMRSFIENWDNGDFHKISTYTRPDNRVAQLLMKRFKYKHVCTLEKHIFGEDYMLYDRELTKTSDTYDLGVNVGFLGNLKQKVREALGF